MVPEAMFTSTISIGVIFLLDLYVSVLLTSICPDHCIDQLRQVLQCHGDMTMNGAIYYEGAQKAFVDTEDTHTCRNFSKLREWANARTRLQSKVVQ